MGTPAAVNYAILFMDTIERKNDPNSPSQGKRCINDFFFSILFWRMASMNSMLFRTTLTPPLLVSDSLSIPPPDRSLFWT